MVKSEQTRLCCSSCLQSVGMSAACAAFELFVQRVLDCPFQMRSSHNRGRWRIRNAEAWSWRERSMRQLSALPLLRAHAWNRFFLAATRPAARHRRHCATPCPSFPSCRGAPAKDGERTCAKERRHLTPSLHPPFSSFSVPFTHLLGAAT